MVLRDYYYHAFKPGLLLFVFCYMFVFVKGYCFYDLRIITKANLTIKAFIFKVNRFCIKFLYKIYGGKNVENPQSHKNYTNNISACQLQLFAPHAINL